MKILAGLKNLESHHKTQSIALQSTFQVYYFTETWSWEKKTPYSASEQYVIIEVITSYQFGDVIIEVFAKVTGIGTQGCRGSRSKFESL